jgi:hypothetical protein
MTHDLVVTEIMTRAKELNILTHYCGRAQNCQGDRGAPDLLCVGFYHAAFIEVKMPHSTLAPEQTSWRHQLAAAGCIHYVVGPGALTNGQIDRILFFLATGKTDQDQISRAAGQLERMVREWPG